MSKKRLPSSKRKTRSAFAIAENFSGKCIKFVGVSLSGGKSDKACIAVLDYYPEKNKIFLAKLFDKIKSEDLISADQKIIEILMSYKTATESIAFDVPISLPKCLHCKLECPGFEVCNEPEIKYQRQLYQSQNKRPKKFFTPYTQRPSEAYLSWQIAEIDFQHALGSNLAPLVARALFLIRRLKAKVIEVQTRLSVWKIGQALKVNKTHLKVYKNSIGGEEARQSILSALIDKWSVFIYRQDLKILIENHYAFDALICSYTAYFHYQNKMVQRPKDFPRHEIWPIIPEL